DCFGGMGHDAPAAQDGSGDLGCDSGGLAGMHAGSDPMAARAGRALRCYQGASSPEFSAAGSAATAFLATFLVAFLTAAFLATFFVAFLAAFFAAFFTAFLVAFLAAFLAAFLTTFFAAFLPKARRAGLPVSSISLMTSSSVS